MARAKTYVLMTWTQKLCLCVRCVVLVVCGCCTLPPAYAHPHEHVHQRHQVLRAQHVVQQRLRAAVGLQAHLRMIWATQGQHTESVTDAGCSAALLPDEACCKAAGLYALFVKVH